MSSATPHETAASTSTTDSTAIVNAMTVDVEDYFQVEAFRTSVGKERWDEYPVRVEDSTRRILDLFDRYEVKGTFFTLGWVAAKCPSLVEEIARRGHEVGCHSYWHGMVYTLTPDEFRQDTADATRALEDVVGQPIRSYRAPCYSVTPKSTWALEILAELGYEIDSSVFPIRHDIYGFDGFPRFAVNARLASGADIIEFPMTTVRKFGRNLPGPGGGYLRIFPSFYSRRALEHVHRVDRQPGVVYLHPWELDPLQPRLHGPLKSRLRHYTGLRSTERKLEKLLTRFRFGTMSEVLKLYPPQRSFEVPLSVDCVG